VSLSLYDVTVPVMQSGFRNMARFLEVGREHAEQSGLSQQDLLEARLAPDMLTLVGQIQRASDTAKFAVTRVTAVPNIPMTDDEKTFDDLQARIAATLAFLENVPANAFDGREDTQVVIKARQQEHTFTGRSYLLEFALPNFFFHVTTAYDLLRHKGVPLGKLNYLGLA
jgi:uncharacterized protein